MSTKHDYHDVDGNPVSLGMLCRREPEWAANRLAELEDENEEIDADYEALLKAVRMKNEKLESENVRLRTSAALHPYGHCTCADAGQCGWCHRSAAVERAVELLDDKMALKAENERLRGAWETVRLDAEQTRQWRAGGGMRPATDTSPFSSLPPSALSWLDSLARRALGEK